MPLIHLIDGVGRSRWLEVPDLRIEYWVPRPQRPFVVGDESPRFHPREEWAAEFRRTNEVDDLGLLIYRQVLR